MNKNNDGNVAIRTNRTVALIGCGMVGMSFIYSSINAGFAEEFILIDKFSELSKGNSLDIEDAIAASTNSGVIVREGNYSDLQNADLLVIAAGRPQKDKESRLDLVVGNSFIMRDIASSVKGSGFTGISLIVSNPVDVLSLVYMKTTGFSAKKVISTGTVLDTARLRIKLGGLLNVNSSSVQAYVIGEHGDSSVAAFRSASIGGMHLFEFMKLKGIDVEQLSSIHEQIVAKAYEIIKRKKASYYGIGNVIADIAKCILKDEKRVMSVSVLLDKTYTKDEVFAGIPCVLGRQGVLQMIKPKLSIEETIAFNKSLDTLVYYNLHAQKELNNDVLVNQDR